jgi:hypothetical protein
MAKEDSQMPQKLIWKIGLDPLLKEEFEKLAEQNHTDASKLARSILYGWTACHLSPQRRAEIGLGEFVFKPPEILIKAVASFRDKGKASEATPAPKPRERKGR